LKRDCASKFFNDGVGVERFGTETGRRAGALKSNVTEPGLYFFPGVDMTKKPIDAEDAATSRAPGR
jgi:hypothetical protein